MKVGTTTLGTVWLETVRRRGGATATASALALLGLLVSMVLFHHWSVGSVVIQVTVAVLFAAGVFVASLVVAVSRLEGKLATAARDIDVLQHRIGVHKGIAAALEGVGPSAGDDDGRLQWLARRAAEVLRTDPFLTEEKVRQVEEIAADQTLNASERLTALEQHLRNRLVEGRYLLP